ncbi:MAG: FHA domain-containing protein [Pyrinomonadaceae bacterium]
MTKCQICGTENLDNSQYCDECGANLNKSLNREKTNNGPQNYQTQISETPLYQSANITSVGLPPMGEDFKGGEIESEQNARPNAKGGHAVLIIERGEAVGTEFTLATDESYIGRWDADNGIFPDVDLDAYDNEAKVSRRHARIIHLNEKYLIEDLGSTNGTYINRGKRLIPGNSHLLNDGDEIIVGKTFLRFNITN